MKAKHTNVFLFHFSPSTSPLVLLLPGGGLCGPELQEESRGPSEPLGRRHGQHGGGSGSRQPITGSRRQIHRCTGEEGHMTVSHVHRAGWKVFMQACSKQVVDVTEVCLSSHSSARGRLPRSHDCDSPSPGVGGASGKESGSIEEKTQLILEQCSVFIMG